MTLERTSPERATPPTRVGVWTGLALLFSGAVLGLLGGFLQAVRVTVGDVALPIGVVVVLVTLLTCIRAVIHAFDTRRAGILILVGWAAVTVLLALPWPGGDVVLAQEPVALVYLFGGVVLATAAANLPARLRPVDAGAVPAPEPGDADAGAGPR